MELFGEGRQFLRGPAGIPVAGTGKKAGFRNIGCDDIRHGQQFLHFRTVTGSDRAVGFSVITHHRIQDDNGGHGRGACGTGAVSALGGQKVSDNIDLGHTAQKTTVDTVKGQTKLPPFFQVIRQNRGTVMHKMYRKTGMIGKEGSRNRAYLYSHGTNNRKGYGGGAPAVACDIIDHGDFGRNPAGCPGLVR